MALATGERSHKVLVPCIHKCMADPRHIQTLFEFCIATSAILWSSIVSRIFGRSRPPCVFARARPFSVRSCLTYRLPPTSRVCTRPRLTWPKVSRCRDTSWPTATFSSRASSAWRPVSFRADVACWQIVLQKSKVAGRRIFRENPKREALADSYDLNRITEVACEFNVRR
jgi:hypothetical protein